MGKKKIIKGRTIEELCKKAEKERRKGQRVINYEFRTRDLKKDAYKEVGYNTAEVIKR